MTSRVVGGSYAAGRATRDALIATAQRLFAEKGFDAVSLREVSVEAGSRNTGAGQYYFGDKENLILQIFERQMPAITSRRLEILDGVSGSADPVREICRAIIAPLGDQIGESRFLLFLARFQAERVRRGARLESDVAATYSQARRTLREEMVALPDALFDHRFALLTKMAVTALADAEWRQINGRKGAANAVVIADLIEVAAAIMRAPGSMVRTETAGAEEAVVEP
ncbi:MAG: acrR [Pseudonocardiales bacterium]|nr:acrR [Pseudonocardiales bacterium]